ncbi:MAG: hypothetical protein K2P78_06625 [Gemmataceae bacterium]|nr:hypothetical protein [Gemmataceae bacterium]
MTDPGWQSNMHFDRLRETVRSGLADIARAITKAVEPPPDDIATAQDPAHELETARHVMRMDAAKQFMASLIVNNADKPTDELCRRAFELANAYVAEALTPANPAQE